MLKIGIFQPIAALHFIRVYTDMAFPAHTASFTLAVVTTLLYSCDAFRVSQPSLAASPALSHSHRCPQLGYPSSRPRLAVRQLQMTAYLRAEGDEAQIDTDAVQSLLDQRAVFRGQGDYEAADGIREQLTAMGVTIHDRARTWSVGPAPRAHRRGGGKKKGRRLGLEADGEEADTWGEALLN